MIVFDLACTCGFTFEGWFQDRTDFEKQQHASLLDCPECGSHEIRKILSPIRYRAAGIQMDSQLQTNCPDSVTPEDVEKALATLQKFVADNFEDVGSDLAKESLKIHYGLAEPRNIRGVTTEYEEEKLRDEGINIMKIPMPIKNGVVN